MSTFPSSQLQALSDLYYDTQGYQWKWLTCTNYWNFTQSEPNPCIQNWCGIICNEQNTSVLVLNLMNHGMKGTITASLDQLTDLQMLNFGKNYLFGEIPSSLSKLIKLRSLTLSNNKLNGTFPDIFSEQSRLSLIDIQENYLTGIVPNSFQTLKYVTEIFLTNNNLWGNLLDWLTADQLSQIHILDLRHNLFSGSIPGVTNLTSFVGLYLRGNNFIGSIPDVFYNSSSLKDFYVSDNYFTGRFPSSLLQLKSLENFMVDDNNFHEEINQLDWSQFSSISMISMARNYLYGEFPITFCDYHHLLVLNLGFNYFSGVLSIAECQMNLYPTVTLLSVQGNSFSGPLHEIFNSSISHLLMDVTLSNNEFTGTLPGKLFLNTPQLQIFGAGTNCLSGTLPSELCQIPLLLGFSVDGASTSQGCRIPIVNIPSLGMNAFTTRKQMRGTIPDCLFNLFYSLSISLSGNAFTGTIPPFDSLKAPQLLNLSISHNRLTGTIAEEWYQLPWKVLDLSYNKFTGSFPDNSKINSSYFAAASSSSMISMEINRLSGDIPSVFTKSEGSINILQGNLLSCNFDKKELPKNDPNSDIYSCGSNIVNSTIYVWLMMIFALMAVIIGRRIWKNFQTDSKPSLTDENIPDSENDTTAIRIEEEGGIERTEKKERSKNEESFLQKIYETISLLLKDNTSMLPPWKGWTMRFFSYTLQMRRFSLVILAFILVVLLPIYATLGVYYRTYTQRYAWTISAIFLSGTNATITLMVFFSLFIVFTIGSVHALFKKSVQEYYDHQLERYCYRKEFNWKILAVWIIAWIINLTIMATADSLYVYVIINRSTKYEYIIQIILALFKLAWHDIGIFRMVYLLKRQLKLRGKSNKKRDDSFFSDDNDERSNGSSLLLTSASLLDTSYLSENLSESAESCNPSSFITNTLLLTRQDIRYLTYMSIINKVIIPCLAIFFISSSCFYNALVSSSPVAANYLVCYGTVSTSTDCVNILGSREDGASYTPAFTYSYQCSSAFLTDYVPVFVFMFLWSSVVFPLIVLCMMKIHDFYQQRDDVWYKRIVCKVTLLFLPVGWGECKESKMSDAFHRRLKRIIINRKQLLTLRVSYTLAVLFVFGSLFPPLAFIASIAVMSITWLEEYLTKKMLLGYSLEGQCDVLSLEYACYVEEESKEIDHSVFKVIQLIVYITCWLFGFLLFDICGDRNGWGNGLIVIILMVVFPWVVYRISVRIKKRNIVDH